ncbi:MAG: HAD family phosphatase [Lachnospiraceae bacterium]|nr:HAD family phosphatase [Lachnospiraceae bacterium]
MQKIVIFDMDGTLLDTEKYYRKYWPQALREYGYEMTDGMSLEMRSLGRPFALEKLHGWYGALPEYQEIRQRRNELVEADLKKYGTELKAGCRELLDWLRAHEWTVAVATSTSEERSRKYLREAGILEYFSRIVCTNMVEEGKPSPQVYLYACEVLQAEPAQVFAVEDAPNGVLSAYRAGLKVIMVPDQAPPDESLSALLYREARDLSEIIPILEEAGREQADFSVQA